MGGGATSSSTIACPSPLNFSTSARADSAGGRKGKLERLIKYFNWGCGAHRVIHYVRGNTWSGGRTREKSTQPNHQCATNDTFIYIYMPYTCTYSVHCMEVALHVLVNYFQGIRIRIFSALLWKLLRKVASSKENIPYVFLVSCHTTHAISSESTVHVHVHLTVLITGRPTLYNCFDSEVDAVSQALLPACRHRGHNK